MAAYAALLSVMHTIHQIKNHPRPPISPHQKQLLSLTENLNFLQDFLERYCSSGGGEDNELEGRIVGAAYAVEDVIESHIVDQREDRRSLKRRHSQMQHGENISSVDLYQSLERAIQDMDLIKTDVMEIIGEKMEAQHLHQLLTNASVSFGSVRPISTVHNSTMVDFGDIVNKVLDKLITVQHYNLQIIPIVGIGGIGKTTLARNIYTDSLVVQHFEILAWVTISQDYRRTEILKVLCQEIKGSMSDVSGERGDELGETLHNHLWGRRYLVVMDDIWSRQAWDAVKYYFPDNYNGSRIMITTRLTNLAFELSGSHHDFKMNFLDEDTSWDLLCKIVFGEEGCPSELENVGKEIVKNCRGLPLSIVVIGGLLKKSNMIQEYWDYTLKNLNSLVNLDNNECCLQILGTSYKELPIHLKPCFLYLGVFREDEKIRVSELIKLWVSEGILRPIDAKSLEEVAEEYLKELVDRNLMLVDELRWNGNVKLCHIHDLLRDLCLRESKKQTFLCFLRPHDVNIPQDTNIKRRICIHENTGDEYSPESLHALESASVTRSLLLMNRGGSYVPSPSFTFRFLRVYSRVDVSFDEERSLTSAEAIFMQANLRYFYMQVDPPFEFPSSWSLFWNLQTIKVNSFFSFETTVTEIWEIPLLRHVMINEIELRDPPCREHNFILENLQTLSCIRDFRCSEEAVRRIPNIKTLKLEYSTDRLFWEEGLPYFCLNNLCRLQKLECLRLYLSHPCHDPEKFHSDLAQNLSFSCSLKKLTLRCIGLSWEDLTTTKIGSLPHLEVLKLEYQSCIGREWATSEGQFCSLKFLLINGCVDLECWKTDDHSHFPRLEHLVLEHLVNLEEIPSSIGDIPTLKSIHLKSCSNSAEDSAERIKEEQEGMGNEDLKVDIG